MTWDKDGDTLAIGNEKTGDFLLDLFQVFQDMGFSLVLIITIVSQSVQDQTENITKIEKKNK